MMCAEVSVLGGLKITVQFDADPADASVGINNSYPCDIRIIEINRRPLKKRESSAWIEKRLSKKDHENIKDACLKALRDHEDGYFE